MQLSWAKRTLQQTVRHHSEGLAPEMWQAAVDAAASKGVASWWGHDFENTQPCEKSYVTSGRARSASGDLYGWWAESLRPATARVKLKAPLNVHVCCRALPCFVFVSFRPRAYSINIDGRD